MGLGGGFFLGRGRLGVHVPALLTKPHGRLHGTPGRAGRAGGFIDFRGNGWRYGLVLGGSGTAIRDEAFDGDDHGEGLDLAGNAASGHFGAEVRDFPEAGQDLFAAQMEAALFAGILLEGLLLDGGAMLEHVSADTRLGFGVVGGIGVEADGFGGTTIGHGSREDQVGKGYFLVSDGVADVFLRHRLAPFLGKLGSCEQAEVFQCAGRVRRNEKSRRGGMLNWLICDKGRVGHRTAVTLSFARA
jgi:hypothetical protein